MLITVAVIHGQTSSYALAYLLHHFLMTHGAMGTQGENNLHVLILHTQLVHLIHQNGHKVMSISHASGIITNKGDFHTWLYQLIDGFAGNGMI